MDKYLKQYRKLQKPYKLSVVFIGVSSVLLVLLIFLVLVPILNISANEATAAGSSNEFDRILIINNILVVPILLSSFAALACALIGKKHDKRKSKK